MPESCLSVSASNGSGPDDAVSEYQQPCKRVSKDQGTLSTMVTSNALQCRWTVDKLEQGGVSPLFLFNSFDTFKIMFRVKVRAKELGESFFVQANGTYGDLPEQVTVSLWCNGNFLKSAKIAPDKKWMHICDMSQCNGAATILFQMHLPYTDVLTLSSPGTNFANLYELPDADITIEAVDGAQRIVHKTVLLARSDVFRALSQNEVLESTSNHLEILELDEDSLNVFISYLYYGYCEHFNLKHCLTMLSVADKYNIKDLHAKCENFIHKILANDNIFEIQTAVEFYNLSSLKARTVQYVSESIADIVLTRAWREANNASFLKTVYEDLVKADSEKVIVGEREYLASTKHCLAVKFPMQIQEDKTSIHYMTVFPEIGSGYFRLRLSEETMTLSICQCQLDDNYCFTGVIVKNINSNDLFMSLHSEEIVLPEMVLNEWYDIADFQILAMDLTITLEISYDLKFIPDNSAFEELLTDSGSADMTLESSDGIFRHVHKSVLIARDLRKMVDECDSKHHLKLCNISKLALDAFIKFVYVGDKEAIKTDYCAELLPVSHIYNLPDLKYQCEIKFMTIIDVINAMDLLSLAVSNNTHFLEQWVLDYVHLNKLNIIGTESWRNCNNCDVIRKLIEHYVDIKELASVTTKTVLVPSLRKPTEEA